MTLVQAIAIKSRTGEEFIRTAPEFIDEADRLSIEAMKRCRSNNLKPQCADFRPLPGETPE